ncbi:CHAP domain-containing protein [Kitasatospora sp. NPDC098652]|uniref:CHAP domain-containing protein n=1 Tax=Kitasatospora sp. NPDC098652 TaxID=3364095 RepID=UPI003811964F
MPQNHHTRRIINERKLITMSRTLRLLSVPLSTALLGACVTLAAPSASAATGSDLATLALNNAGKGAGSCSVVNSAPNSLGGTSFGSSCKPEYWCSDFAIWVWQNAGLDVAGLTASSGTFYAYGQARGTLHTGPDYRPQLGDAVLYNYNGAGRADHVGLVTKVNADGSVLTTNGDWGGQGSDEAAFARTATVQNLTLGAAEVPVGSVPTAVNMRISAYISPAGLTGARNSRIGVLQNGALTVKQGALTAGWSPEWGGGLARFKVSGSWIGVLTTGGELYVKEGDLNAPWVDERGGVADFELDQGAGRVGVLTTDGHAVVKDGGLAGSWVDQTNGVKQLRLSGDWVGVVFNDGTASVKEGGLLAGWTPETNNVADLQLDRAAGRVGVLTKDGHAIVKDGGLAGSWVDQTNGVKQLRLSGDWVGVVFNDGTASVKEGGLLAGWTPETNNVADLQLDRASGRVGVLSTDGHAIVKDGGLTGGWTDQTNGVQQLGLTSY